MYHVSYLHFTIILKHAVNEVKISFYSFFAYLSAYLVQLYSEDKVLTLLLTLTSPVTIYTADGLSCSFLMNLQRILSF